MPQEDKTAQAGHHGPSIHIDKTRFEAPSDRMSGAELRELPQPPVDASRDLYLEVPGPGADELIDDATVVELKNGMHFFTAPRSITPGLAA